MALHDLKREYEERRQALIDQLQKNHSLDAATQHQIYGAIKEIESFLSTIEYQIATEQQRNINIDLARDQPSPVADRTRSGFRTVTTGTKRVFTEHIPNAAKTVVTAPKRFFDKRREEARLRAEIEREVRMRKEAEHAIAQHHEQPAELLPPTEPQHQEWRPPTTPEEERIEIAEVRALNQEASEHEQEIVAKRPGNKQVLKVARPGKRQHRMAKPSKQKARPSRHAQGKKGGQHKPHLKRDKYRR